LADYDPISRQGFSRQRADWLVGINLTRYMSIGNPTLFSVGRVQTAVLSAIAARNNEIQQFIPQPYNELEAIICSVSGAEIKAWLLNPKTQKTAFPPGDSYLSRARAESLNKPISDVQSRTVTKTNKPEKLLNITGLQKTAYKKFGLTPEKTLDIAQVLYEKYKCLSYPRTPSRVMGDNNVELFREKYKLLKNHFSHISQFSDPSLIRQNNTHIFDSASLEDHHALIPLDILPETASKQERDIYEIVVTSFFTVCMPDHIFTEKQVLFSVDGYVFKSSIKSVEQWGWKKTVPLEEKDTEGTAEQEISGFDENNCTLIGTTVLDKKTSPKKEFSLDTVLAFMENPQNEEGGKLAGLGTPATRAAILKTLFDRDYVTENKKKLYATRKGLFMLSQLSKDDQLKKITDVAHTTEWEKQLQENPDLFESSIKEFIRSCIKKGKKETFVKESVGVCPVCGSPVYEGKKSYSCSAFKAPVPCCFTIWKKISEAKISLTDVALLLKGKSTPVKKCKSKMGKEFTASFSLTPEGKISFIFPPNKKHPGGKK
jgi:DNA topoisomerase-3